MPLSKTPSYHGIPRLLLKELQDVRHGVAVGFSKCNLGFLGETYECNYMVVANKAHRGL